MIKLMVRVMQENDAPPEQYERIGFPPDGNVNEDHLLLAAQASQPIHSHVDHWAQISSIVAMFRLDRKQTASRMAPLISTRTRLTGEPAL